MSDVRPELSVNSKYWLDRHRFYELKHFCLQYRQWKEILESIPDIRLGTRLYEQMYVNVGEPSDPVFKTVEEREFYTNRIEMVKRAAKMADPDLWEYIVRGVTEGLSYDYLKTNLGIPASKDMYYDRYRKFFLILSKLRK